MEPHKIFSIVSRCPVCNNENLDISTYTYEVPHFGEVIIEVWKCSNCGYRKSDVSTLKHEGEVRIIFPVKNQEDLNALVIKSSTATVEIPELGIEILPGPAAQGYITTVEGLLERILENTPSECFEESNSCYEFVKKVKKAMNGEINFTIILTDPYGRSTIK
ncbi:MAG: ZPR1 zinc finger domain-containing protein [Desulfurococcaceae archaeon TW002]